MATMYVVRHYREIERVQIVSQERTQRERAAALESQLKMEKEKVKEKEKAVHCFAKVLLTITGAIQIFEQIGDTISKEKVTKKAPVPSFKENQVFVHDARKAKDSEPSTSTLKRSSWEDGHSWKFISSEFEYQNGKMYEAKKFKSDCIVNANYRRTVYTEMDLSTNTHGHYVVINYYTEEEDNDKYSEPKPTPPIIKEEPTKTAFCGMVVPLRWENYEYAEPESQKISPPLAPLSPKPKLAKPPPPPPRKIGNNLLDEDDYDLEVTCCFFKFNIVKK